MEKRFIVNGMLGSLARKLRMYGFFTLYDPSLDDDDLIKLADSRNLILLTSDRELFERTLKRHVNSVLVTGSSDIAKLVDIFRVLKISAKEIEPEKSRCPVCNGTLREKDKSSIGKTLPPNVLQRHNKFYACRGCGKLYWEGSHWRRIESLAKEVRKKLAQN